MEHLSNDDIADAGLADWRKLAQELHARFVADDPATALAFAAETGRLDAEAGVGSAARLRLIVEGPTIDLQLGTARDGRWVTAGDLERARAISELARDRGLQPRPRSVTQLELALDTADDTRVSAFWTALLTGDPANMVYDSVFDPWDRVPAVWFQPSDPHEVPHQRWHFDLWLAPEEAPVRIAAALAAGGTVVDETGAPRFTVLSDADGNRVCVCTSLGR